MSYYPLLRAPGCSGVTTLYNFAPNNYEERAKRERFVNLTWSDGQLWQSRKLATLKYGETMRIRAADVTGIVPEDALPLLSLSDITLPYEIDKLPTTGMPYTSTPNWRATLGLESSCGASTCYQGELDPFPLPGSMLTFGHFMQSGVEVENYLLLINLEASPKARKARLEVRDAAQPNRLLTSSLIFNNQVNIIKLSWIDMNEAELPVLVCRNMSGIPLYFSRTSDSRYLSLEHTHPPASTVVHGRRWDAQKLLKQLWFSKVGDV